MKPIRFNIKILTLLTAVICSVIAFYTITQGPQLAERQAKQALDRVLVPLGFKPIEIGNVQFSWSQVTFQKLVTVAPTGEKTRPHHLSIERLAVTLSPWQVLRGRISTAEIQGLRFVISPQGTPLPWEKVFTGNNNAPFARLSIKDSVIEAPIGNKIIKTPFDLDVLWGSTPSIRLSWGNAQEHLPHGHITLNLVESAASVVIDAQNSILDFDHFKVSIPTVKGELLLTEGNQKGTIEADIQDLTIHNAIKFTQPTKLIVKANEEGAEGKLTTQDQKTDFLKVHAKKPYTSLSLDVPKQSLGALFGVINKGQKHLTPLKGSLEIYGDINSLTSCNLFIKATDLSIGLPTVAVDNLSTTLKVVSFFPFVSPPYQRATIQAIQLMGISAKDIHLEFGLSEVEGFLPSEIGAKLLGGDAQFLHFEKSKNSLIFLGEFKSLDLAQIIQMSGQDNLHIEGQISGKANLKYTENIGLDIVDAEFKSASDIGRLQLKTQLNESKDSSTSAVFEALEDFHYTNLTLGIRPSTTEPGNLEAIIKLLGSNPNLLQGYPFEFNINASGKLRDLVVNTINNLSNPKDVKELSRNLAKGKEKKEK